MMSSDDHLFAPWDGRRVPVTILGGHLGAGKTTMINELLSATDRPIAVLVNDVGRVNVDAALIARRSAGGDVIELTDGCVCCSLAGGLADAFDSLRARPEPPDHVVLELSGVAEPGRVVPWAGTAGFRLDGVVVLIDAEQFLDRVDHPVIGETVRNQTIEADLLVLTKTDLADGERIAATRRRLAELAPDRPIVEPGSPTAAAALIGTATRRPGGVAATPTPSLFDAHTTTTLSIPDPIPLDELTGLLDGLPDDVLRAKGVVRDTDGRSHLVQVVGWRRSIEPLPDAERQAPTDLVVIAAR